MAAKAPWMTPGAPRVAKPSWLRVQPFAEPEPPPPVDVMPSMPPPRSLRPSVPPPPSSRRNPPQIQTTRELELESEVVALHNELSRVTSEAAAMKARVMEEAEPAVIALAVAIARRIVAREVSVDPALMAAWIREAHGALPDGVVFVAADLASDEHVTDPALPAGTAQVRAGASTIEVGADARMAAMADALGVDR